MVVEDSDTSIIETFHLSVIKYLKYKGGIKD